MRKLLVAALLLLASPASAQLSSVPATEPMPYISVPTRINDTTSVLLEWSKPRPALGVAFNDTVYSTQFMRISTDTTLSDDQGRVPIYSQLQAWNADQSKLILSDGTILNSPSFTYYRRESLPGNFRWSPIYPDSGYYSSNSGGVPTFKLYNIRTATSTTVKSFPEYRVLELKNEWEDLDETGTFVVLQGQKHCSPSGTCPVGFGTDSDTIQVLCTITSGVATFSPTSGGGQTDSLEVDSRVYGTGIPAGCKITGINRGTKVVTVSPAPSGFTGSTTLTFTNSEAFMLNVKTGWKGRAVQTWTPVATGIGDMLASPRGDFMILVWGGFSADTLDQCGIIAYDSTGAYKGTITGSTGHFDVTIDKDGSQWLVNAMGSAEFGPQDLAIAKHKIPNGYNLWKLGYGSAGFQYLVPFGNVGGVHISARAFRSGFAIVSGDDDVTINPTRGLGSHEIWKVYLDSKRKTDGAPHFERLADTRSSAYQIYNDPNAHNACGVSSYWAQPHATVSRDGTRLLWGSSFRTTDSCRCEAYTMNINRAGRNETFVNQTPNTWRRLTPARVRKFDGTGLGPADTFAVYHDYSHSSFAPEYGGIWYYGGGGHGGRKGNDVWFYNAGDTTWTQVTAADTLTQASYPGDGTNGGYSVRSFLKVTLGNDWATGPAPNDGWSPRADPSRHGANDVPAAFRPWGSIKGTQRPWSAHIYQQQSWDSRNRIYQVWNPQWTTTPQPDSTGQPDGWYGFRSKNTFRFDPYSKQWTCANDTMPDLYAGNGGSAYDPVHRRTLAFSYDCQHTAGGGDYWAYYSDCKKVAVQDSIGRWTMKPAYPKYCDAGQDTFRFYGDTASWDRLNNKFLVYSGQAYATNCTGDNSVTNNNLRLRAYDAMTDTWTKPPQIADATNGYPPNGDAFSAYSSKDSALLIFGYQRNYGVWSPAWKWAASNGQWSKLTTTNQPYIDGGTTYSDVNTPLSYDPTNNIFLLIRWKNGEPTNVSGSGGSAMTNGSVSEMWTYKMSAGDGRLWDPYTVSGPSCGASAGW